jgi:GH24 family phage-related lysozyme (muramidase)
VIVLIIVGVGLALVSSKAIAANSTLQFFDESIQPNIFGSDYIPEVNVDDDAFVPDYANDYVGDFSNSEYTPSYVPAEDQIFTEQIESTSNMKPSQQLIDSLKKTEGLSLKKYRDTSKGWSIGYGRFFPGGVGIPDSINRETAEQWLAEDLEERAAKYVRLYITRALTQPQFDGFTHMFYNISPPSMRNIAKAFNSYGDWQSVALRYTLPGQKEEPMLIKRRQSEIAMIERGIYA